MMKRCLGHTWKCADFDARLGLWRLSASGFDQYHQGCTVSSAINSLSQEHDLLMKKYGTNRVPFSGDIVNLLEVAPD